MSKLLKLPDVLIYEIIDYLESDDFYRFIKSNKMLNNNFEYALEGLKNNWLHIFLEVKMTSIFYNEHRIIISRYGNNLSKNTRKYISVDDDARGKKYSYIHVCNDHKIRNIRMFKNSIFFTRFVNDMYIKFVKVPIISNHLEEILPHIPVDDKRGLYEKRKNIYYILYNTYRRKDGKHYVSSKINHIYNEWDFNGIYICKSIDEILDSLVVLLKKGITHMYKWLEKNTMGSILEYVKTLYKYTNQKTKKFIEQLCWAPIYTDRMYKINIINKWKRVYEYGSSCLSIDDSGRKIIERDEFGEERYIKTYSISDITGFSDVGEETNQKKITKYFF